MDAPELTNFGSLVRHALTLESTAATFYEDSVRLLPPGSSADLMRELSGQHEGRHRLLERTRQQKLNEMVLEPISGMDGSRYVVDVAMTSTSDRQAKAMAIEEVSRRFYHESSVIAKSLLTEAARIFEKLGDENARNLSRLRETWSG